MSYRLHPQETIADGIKRIVVEQLDTALDRLQSTRGNPDDAIHESRVCLKKIRAVLRLVQTAIDPDLFRQENACFRDAGRRLAAIRDTAATLETMDKLTARFADQLAPEAFRELRQPLRHISAARQLEKKQVMVAVAKTLRAARRRVAHWPIHHHGFSALGPGMKRVYKQGRQSLAHACEQPSVEHFHEWRKHVKSLRYQIPILKPIWPVMMKSLADALDILGEYLSDDHDLALLRQRVLELTEPSGDRPDLEALIALIDQRRGELEARRLGERLYIDKPQVFIGRVQVYWRVWREEVQIDPIAVS
jgi:CHAD domain-containing protein